MSKIADLVEVRMSEEARKAADKVEVTALAEIRQITRDVVQVKGRVDEVLRRVDALAVARSKPRPPAPVPVHRRPVLLLQIAVGLLVLLLIGGLVLFALQPAPKMLCRPGKAGVMLCEGL